MSHSQKLKTVEHLSWRLFEIKAAVESPMSDHLDVYDRELLDRLAETMGSFLACVADDGEMTEEVLGGFITNLRRDLNWAQADFTPAQKFKAKYGVHPLEPPLDAEEDYEDEHRNSCPACQAEMPEGEPDTLCSDCSEKLRKVAV